MMKKRSGILLISLILILVLGMSSYYYVFNKPRRSIQNETAIAVTAREIFNQYSHDEKAANTLYLDKAIAVTGEVSEIKTNQEGRMVIALKTDDPIFGVICTLVESASSIKSGDQVKVRGFCSGFTSDVVLRDCELIHP